MYRSKRVTLRSIESPKIERSEEKNTKNKKYKKYKKYKSNRQKNRNKRCLIASTKSPEERRGTATKLTFLSLKGIHGHHLEDEQAVARALYEPEHSVNAAQYISYFHSDVRRGQETRALQQRDARPSDLKEGKSGASERGNKRVLLYGMACHKTVFFLPRVGAPTGAREALTRSIGFPPQPITAVKK